MEISPLQPGIKASELPLEQLARNSNVSEQDKVGEACRQFEAVLLRQILSEARKTVIAGGEEQDPTTDGIYDDMINNQLADGISHSGSFGLAKSLETQLGRQILPHSAGQGTTGISKP